MGGPNPNSLVFDGSLRTISNFLVDQTLGTPAGILEGLARAGSDDPLTDLSAITAIYLAFKPASDMIVGKARLFSCGMRGVFLLA